MNLKYLDEPELEFGTSSHIDIKFGIMNYGVLDFAEADSARKIHLGIIGVNEDIEKFLEWVDRCKSPIEGKNSNKKNLFPRFLDSILNKVFTVSYQLVEIFRV